MSYTAHIRKNDNAEQSVSEHCFNTSLLAQGYLEEIGLGKIGKLAGLLHDIGKFTEDFNDYIHEKNTIKRGELDHSFAGAKYLNEMIRNADDSNYRKTASLIGRVILSHHGLHDWINDDCEDTYKQRTDKNKYYSEIMSNFTVSALNKDIDELMDKSVSEVRTLRSKLRDMSDGSQERFAFYLGMLERLLQSVLIDADRTDTADFMSGRSTEMHFDTEKLWKDIHDRLDRKLIEFSYQKDTISKLRRNISDRCAEYAKRDRDVHICRLIVPTGGGKTLSSLRFAVNYAIKHSIEKIIYVAPFMSILEQNSDVLRSIVGEDAFLEHHSNMLSEVSYDDERLIEYEMRTEKWDSPVIATTMVQFLNSLFSRKNDSVRRTHRLSRAVIIIDEIQSLPVRCVYLFNLAMNFLSHVCGSVIVLCTATQPPLESMTDHPLLLDADSSMTGDTAADFRTFKRTEPRYLDKKGGYSYDEAAEICRDEFIKNGSLLFIVNTKLAAKEMYQRLKDMPDASVFHLSTNMCPAHRSDCINRIKDKLSDKQPVICIATQLIEAGVDISFGCVIRSLAGMDNFAQAAGRCNRNGEHDKLCPVYTLYLYEEKLGNLREITSGQNISREMLDAPNETDHLSPERQSEYLGKFYHSTKRSLRYPLSDTTDCDILNLLSLNKHRITDKIKHLKFCGQAFKKAGSLFEVIDTHTKNVFVPYNTEAEELLRKLETETEHSEIVKLLRRAQKYSVNIYSGTEKKLNNETAIYPLKCGGYDSTVINVLEKRFYDKEYGITTEGGEREVLML